VSGKRINRKRILVFAGALVGIAVLFLGIVFFLPNSFDPSPQFITLSRGQSFSSVADSLKVRRMIFSRSMFDIAGRILNVTQKMKFGKYRFESGISNYSMLRDFEKGFSTVNTSITLNEGVRAALYARILKRHLGIDSMRFIEACSDTSLIGIYPHGSSSLEGYLMPNTYQLYWQEDEKTIVKHLVGEFRKFFADSLQLRMKQLGYSLNDVLTMASIVEGEAVYDDERPIIAGVYYNRLRKRMPLQADPTVLYAVSDVPKRLTKADLKIDSPYNTYLRYGLPPGPINNPSRQSILAALYPAKHSYLYFVSDNNGRHRFAKSYQEHQRNVRLYKLARQSAQNAKNQ
jgi:UPF0755 protein